ncbi:GAF domain-containing protein [Spirosoma sp. SC4-14]|uniref:GAF domain-containing protein n=1 Tax=Spirosoma sp. SC4-14 TaxID=3128900 RepID=UPI0030CEE881
METKLYTPTLPDQPLLFRLSFRPFVSYLKSQQQQAFSGALDQFYSYLIKQFEQAVILTEQPENDQLVPRLKAYFELATVVVLPLISNDATVPYAFGLPVPLRLYHYSAAFAHLTRLFPLMLTEDKVQESGVDRARFLYRLILEKCYRITVPGYSGPTVRFEQALDGLTRYYQMDINISFVEPHPNGPLPPLEPAWIDFVRYGHPIPAGINPLPLHQFSFEGFSFFKIEDVSEAESIKQLREVFVHLASTPEPVIFQTFETALRNFCGQPGLEVGVMPLTQINGRPFFTPSSQQRSVFLRLSGFQMDADIDPATQRMLDELIHNPQPRRFAGLDALPEFARKVLEQKGIQSFLIYPVTDGPMLLGLLEMGSPRPDAFHDEIFTYIGRILPLIQELLRFQLQQFTNQLEQLIKLRYTSLQPAVEWKFYEAAGLELSLQQAGTVGKAVPIRFSKVYPFYGAVDIRNSSVERQKAIRQDLTDQLAMIDELLKTVQFPDDPVRLAHLRLATTGWQAKVMAGLTPDNELSIGRFLNSEVTPFIRLLESIPDVPTILLQEYFNRMDGETGRFCQAQTNFDHSIDRINVLINTYINQQQKQLQTRFPHYFERFRTDGTEYTLYVGQSIAPNHPFSIEICQYLYEWQLDSMIELAWLTHRLRLQLPLPLQTTQLILAHEQPVDIGFRHDERRFDVEGSYSIRYEVIKKRIDKALIAGTHERLTQPDTIALIYSHATELVQYLPFINRLQAEGKLKPSTEQFDLEPLKGVANLKALRLTINYPGPKSPSEV